MDYQIYEVVIRYLDTPDEEPHAVLVSVGEDQPEEGGEDDEACFYHFFPFEWEDLCKTIKEGFRYDVDGEFRVENHGDEYIEDLASEPDDEPEPIGDEVEGESEQEPEQGA
jgi:hypothetical protein